MAKPQVPHTSKMDHSSEETNFKIHVGAFSYGADQLNVKSWGGEFTNLYIGRYCSIAENVQIFLGGNHRMDWISTYPFGYIHNESFPSDPRPETIYSKGGCSNW